MADKIIIFFSIFGIVLVACALIISFRLRRLNALKAAAEQQKGAALEEMNRLTKELRARSTSGQVQATLPPGERLQHMYPGVKRPQGDPQSS